MSFHLIFKGSLEKYLIKLEKKIQIKLSEKQINKNQSYLRVPGFSPPSNYRSISSINNYFAQRIQFTCKSTTNAIKYPLLSCVQIYENRLKKEFKKGVATSNQCSMHWGSFKNAIHDRCSTIRLGCSSIFYTM